MVAKDLKINFGEIINKDIALRNNVEKINERGDNTDDYN